MGLSVIDIWNRALNHLGASTLESVDDTKPTASRLRTIWPQVLDELLDTHPWSFAQKIVALGYLGAPSTKYAYSYQLPGDCVSPMQLADKGDNWEVFGDQLHTDRQGAVLIYTARIDDPVLYHAKFVKALSLLLAANMSYVLVQKPDLQTFWENKARAALDEAMLSDARVGNEAQSQTSSFESARFGTPPGEGTGSYREPTPLSSGGWEES